MPDKNKSMEEIAKEWTSEAAKCAKECYGYSEQDTDTDGDYAEPKTRGSLMQTKYDKGK